MYQAARVRHRVRSYKRGLTVAALIGFSTFGVLIGDPYLNIPTSSHMTQTTTSAIHQHARKDQTRFDTSMTPYFSTGCCYVVAGRKSVTL